MDNLAVRVRLRTGEEAETWIYPISQIAFERRFGRGFWPTFSDVADWHTEWLAWVAWHAVGAPETFETWLLGLDSVHLGVREPAPVADD